MSIEELSKALGERRIIHNIVGDKLVVSHDSISMSIGGFNDATEMSQQAMMAANAVDGVKLAPSSTGSEIHFILKKD